MVSLENTFFFPRFRKRLVISDMFYITSLICYTCVFFFVQQAEGALLKLGQSESLKPEVKPLSDALVQDILFHHVDKDVRLLVAACFCEIIRVLAPNPPFSDKTFEVIM